MRACVAVASAGRHHPVSQQDVAAGAVRQLPDGAAADGVGGRRLGRLGGGWGGQDWVGWGSDAPAPHPAPDARPLAPWPPWLPRRRCGRRLPPLTHVLERLLFYYFVYSIMNVLMDVIYSTLFYAPQEVRRDGPASRTQLQLAAKAQPNIVDRCGPPARHVTPTCVHTSQTPRLSAPTCVPHLSTRLLASDAHVCCTPRKRVTAEHARSHDHRPAARPS
jgi:hypothetical protein